MLKQIMISAALSLGVMQANAQQAVNGEYSSTYGELRLQEKDGIVFGDYKGVGVIVGERKGDTIDATFLNNDRVGKIKFKTVGQPNGNSSSAVPTLEGKWNWIGESNTGTWNASLEQAGPVKLKNFGSTSSGKSFAGTWRTNFGTLRIVEMNGVHAGLYGDRGILYGTVSGNTLKGHFTNGTSVGDLEFVSTTDGKHTGRWRYKGQNWSGMNGWTGTRTTAPARAPSLEKMLTIRFEAANVCVQKVDDWGFSGSNEDIDAIIGSEMRFKNSQGQIVSLYPDFYSGNRSKFRTWGDGQVSVYYDPDGYMSIGEKSCGGPIKQVAEFEVDVTKYGYRSVTEFEQLAAAEFFVSASLQDLEPGISTPQSLGQRDLVHSLSALPVCGTCENGPGSRKVDTWKTLTSKRPGSSNGVLGPFRPTPSNANSANAQVHYNIERIASP